MNSFEGKVVMVTGAGNKRSMGHAVALRLAREGANVVVVDKAEVPKSLWPGDENWGGLEEVVTEINSLGREALAVVADISSSEAVNEIVVKALERFGKIDILVHCAAIRGPVGTPLIELDEEIWRSVLDVNLTGSFLISKAVARTMIPDGEGKKIVIIASLAGTKGVAQSGAYCASKWGTIGLVKTLALELAQYKINVNAINPGAFLTNLRDESTAEMARAQGITWAEAREKGSQMAGSRIPLGRMGTTDDIADLVVFLVSDQSKYITGVAVDIDGGGF